MTMVLHLEAVVRSIMIGDPDYPECKFFKTVETFEREEDFEEYDLSGAPSGSFGRRYDKDGKDVGTWDPTLYATLEESPIRLEIQRYQDFLLSLRKESKINVDDKIVRNWWTTRKERTPLQVTAANRKSRVVHEVVHWAWGGKEVTVAKSPPATVDNFVDLKFKVYSQGGNQADRQMRFTFAAEDGSHSFVFKATDFKDDKETTVTKKVKKNTKYKVTASGNYKGKGVEQGLVGSLGRKPKEIKGNEKGTVIFADFVKSANDNDDLQVEATQGIFRATNERKRDGHSTNDLTYIFESTKDFKPQPKTKRVIEDSFMNLHAISPVPPSNAPGSDFAGIEHTLEWEEDFPYDGDYIFRFLADNVADIFLDNELVGRTRRFKGSPDKLKKFCKVWRS